MNTELYTNLQTLIGSRGTIQQIEAAIHDVTGVSTTLSPFEENLDDNDLGFQFSLESFDDIEDNYYDFDIYLIQTRAWDYLEPVWYITEINWSY